MTYALLAAIAVAATLTLSQCTMVGDNVTGVRVTTLQSRECEKQCTQDFVKATAAEAKRHVEEMQRCATLPEADRAACRQAETERFLQNLKDLLQSWKACINSCHQQGAGSSG